MDEDLKEPAAVAVIRAWVENGPVAVLKIRVTGVPDVAHDFHTIGVTTDPEEACDLIRSWLETFAAAHGARR